MRSRDTKQVVINLVLYHTRAAILPLTTEHITPGSTIYSDRFSVYFNDHTLPSTSSLTQYGYQHFGINHSVHFMSEIDNTIPTNMIERTWRSIKEKFRNNKHRVDIDKHISQYMFEAWIPQEDRFD